MAQSQTDRDFLRVKVAEHRDGSHEVIYTLNRNLEVTHVRWADVLKGLHRKMESRGELDHPLTDAEMQQMSPGTGAERASASP